MSISDKIVIGASGVGLFSWVTNKLYGNLTDAVYNRNARVYEPVGTVSIVIPAYNEEEYMETCLKSVLSQNIIQEYSDLFFECIVVDNESTDRTAEIAKQYCQVTTAPRGKLNARHAGIMHASGDIIVSCDADCYYPPNWLNLILYHFHNPEVIAVFGPHLVQGNILFRIGLVWYWNIARPTKLHGSNSAFLKRAYFDVNGFDLSINQLNREEMQVEEEILFLAKLRSIGKVIYEVKACNFASGRHLELKARNVQRTKSKYVQEIERGERF